MSLPASSANTRQSTLRLSIAYACYLGGIALSVTYWPLYFKASGLSGTQIGTIFSVATAISIVMQPLVSAWSDVWGRPVHMLRAAFVWSMLLPGLMLWATDFWGFAMAWWMAGLMSIAIVPLLDASIVRSVGADRFGDVRLWGSVGYGVVVLAYGALMRAQPAETTGAGAVIAWMILLGMGACAVWRLPSPRRSEANHAPTPPANTQEAQAFKDHDAAHAEPAASAEDLSSYARTMLKDSADRQDLAIKGGFATESADLEGGVSPVRQRMTDWIRAPLVILFLINALHWWGITSFNIYIALHGEARGMDTAVVGMTAAAAIVGEVAAFALARRMLSAARAHRVLPLVFLTGAVRWLITAFTLSPVVMISVQLLHFLGFGVWVAALIHMIGRFVSNEQRTAAQGLMGGLTYGVGGMLGNWVSGVMFDIGGGPLVFMVAAGADLLACLLLLLTWRLWRTRAIASKDRQMLMKCRERESNPQGASLREILSLLRLPVSPSRRVPGLIDDRSK